MFQGLIEWFFGFEFVIIVTNYLKTLAANWVIHRRLLRARGVADAIDRFLDGNQIIPNRGIIGQFCDNLFGNYNIYWILVSFSNFRLPWEVESWIIRQVDRWVELPLRQNPNEALGQILGVGIVPLRAPRSPITEGG